ncbi:hypothetical protein WR25_04260 [Diploscapter pachys]|uniref:DnaJ homolog subfamily C member 1 n=1 Tax=Diploscapter pachys TaxID=2018661 RepID=A0A2A2K1F7_9BILA|nr:hypothetical protein WR25_04260 [Diploscapter pachys]
MLPLLVVLPILVTAQWSTEQLALYDLVEEINENFYKLYGISQEATTNEIKKAYRKLSLEWHPDRNQAENANEKFRQIAGIYEILKNSDLRQKYNDVLEFGLPNWRNPVFYYRRMRKMAWYEAIFVLLAVATLAHYLMMWGTYFEKRLAYSQYLEKLSKKKDKAEEARMVQETLESYKPNKWKLLPVLLAKWSYLIALELLWLLKERMTKKEDIKSGDSEEDTKEVMRPKSIPQPVYEFEVARDLKPVVDMGQKPESLSQEEVIKSSREAWSPAELTMLVKLSTEKYPQGTPNRWTLMAQAMNRREDDVTAMVGKLKQMKQEEYTKLLSAQNTIASTTSETSNKAAPIISDWSQDEQRQLELALQKFPKGTDQRWERISEFMETRTKEECMQRFKELAQMVRNRKQTAN